MVWWVEDYLELLKYEICLKIGWVWMVFALMLMAMWLFPKWRALFDYPQIWGSKICLTW